MARSGIDHELIIRRLRWWGLSANTDGTIKIKKVRCGKENCSTCPHSYYAVLISGPRDFRKEKYLGACDADGRPRTPYT